MHIDSNVFYELQNLRLSTYVFNEEKQCFCTQHADHSDALKIRDIVSIVEKLNEFGLDYSVNKLAEITIAPRP